MNVAAAMAMERTIDSSPAEAPKLCYLDATQIGGPLADFEGVEVRNRQDGKIGCLDGIVIDPEEGRVRYLVVDNQRFLRRHFYLIPLDAAQVDVEHRAVFIDTDQADLTSCEEFEPAHFRAFSLESR